MNSLTFTVETITPELAKVLLEQNTINRPIKPTRVLMYASSMAAYEWTVTGEPLLFSRNGLLLNGQHRLMACVKSNTPFTTAIVRGVDETARRDMDTGVPRSVADALTDAGLVSSRRIGGVAKVLLEWRLGFPVGREGQLSIPRREILTLAIEHEDALRRADCEAQRTFQRVRISQSVLGAFYYQVEQIDEDVAQEFTSLLRSGANLTDGHPILAVRAWAINSVRLKRTHRDIAIVLTKGWNDYVNGRSSITFYKVLPGMMVPDLVGQDINA